MRGFYSMKSKFIFSGFALLIAIAFPLQASDGPSIEETQDFIISKTAIKNENYGSPYLKETYFYENCEMTVVTTYIEKEPYKTITSTTNLEDLDPSEVQIYNGNVAMIATDDKEVVKVSYKRNGEKYEKDAYFSEVHLRSTTSNLDRVMKAMTHLIKMCGGKTQLF